MAIHDTPIGTTIQIACDDLTAGRLPDGADRALVVRAAREFIANPSRARDAMLRQEALRERDAWLRRLAAEYCNGEGAARQIGIWAMRYQAGSWQRDRDAASCPDHLRGTPDFYLWHAFATYPKILGIRRLIDILK